MAKTELKLKTTNAATGQNITTTVGYVNPTADSQTLKTFGQKLNAFTTNNYVETDRVQTINVDTEEVVIPDTRPTPTITLTKFSHREGTLETLVSANYTYDGDGIICGYAEGYPLTIEPSQKIIHTSNGIISNNPIVTLISTSTENYKSAQISKRANAD